MRLLFRKFCQFVIFSFVRYNYERKSKMHNSKNDDDENEKKTEPSVAKNSVL